MRSSESGHRERGGALLQELENIFSAHMKMAEGLPLVLSLWILHTHMYQDFSVTVISGFIPQ